MGKTLFSSTNICPIRQVFNCDGRREYTAFKRKPAAHSSLAVYKEIIEEIADTLLDMASRDLRCHQQIQKEAGG
jgi:hypothetical protein